MPVVINSPQKRKHVNESRNGTPVKRQKVTTTTTLKTLDPKLKQTILERLTCRKSPQKLIGLEKQYKEVYKLIFNCVKYKESKSSLVIGPRGVGKTCLIESVLNDIKNQVDECGVESIDKDGVETESGSECECEPESEKVIETETETNTNTNTRIIAKNPKFITIKLNGKYQIDDQTAIKEIGLQLDWFLYSSGISDAPIFEKGHSSEIMKKIMMIIDPISETDDPILIELKKFSIIFLIDEFDIFTNGSKQTLLYNLFDVAQSSGDESRDHASIVIIGVSCKTTVREQLEKRVKSRFSQRIIQINKVKTLDEYLELVYRILIDDKEDLLNEIIRNDTTIRKLIIENYYTIKDLRTIKGSLKSYINGLLIKPNYNNRSLLLLDSLSQLELKLLISITRSGGDSCEIQFEMAYEQYCKHAKRLSTSLNHSLAHVGKVKTSGEITTRDTLLVCWEKLISKGLLTPHNGGFSADVTIDELVRSARRDGLEWVAHWTKIT